MTTTTATYSRAAGPILAAAALLGSGGVAQAQNVTLHQGAGVGTAQFTTDPFGAVDPCCGTGSSIVLSRAGGPTGMTCNQWLTVIDPGAAAHSFLTTCPVNAAGDDPVLTSDTPQGPAQRDTTFTLPSMPGITVTLHQQADSGLQLSQLYTFSNANGAPKNLTLVFFTDTDVDVLGGANDNSGWMYNVGRRGPTPSSVTIMESTRTVRVTSSSMPSPAGLHDFLDGYRVAQFQGDNESRDADAPGLTGFPAAHLGGLFYSLGQAPGNSSFAGEGPGDPDCDGLTDYQAPTVGATQWRIQIPAGGAETFLTRTLLEDGPDPVVAGGTCGTTCIAIQRGVSGNVADAAIQQASPALNSGAAAVAASGQTPGSYQELLLRFDLSGIPAGATINSAMVSLVTYTTAAATVNVHAATAPWAEGTVTWTSFAGAYAAAADESFTTPGTGLQTLSFDVTPRAQTWVSGAVPNDGLLLEQAPTGKTFYETSDHATVAWHPRLDVCYSL